MTNLIKDEKQKASIILCLLNACLLAYTAWLKFYDANAGCQACKNNVFFLPISDSGVALLGLLSCVILAFLIKMSVRYQRLNYAIMILATFFASVASMLQAAQFRWANQICYYCVSSAVLFYLIFGILLYQIVLRRLFLKPDLHSTL